jgi:CubicO group peptidase (beta-lactamase class C family)
MAVAVVERSALSTLRFVDPQLDSTRRHDVVAAADPRPIPRRLRPVDVAIHGGGRTRDLETWMADTCTTSLLTIGGSLGIGAIAYEWYAEDVGPASLLLGASMTKSALAHLVGLAVAEGALALEDPVLRHVPELEGSGYDGCTVEQVLSMTTGTAWVEDHRDVAGPAARLVGCFAGDGADSRAMLTSIAGQDPPGTRWEYSTADSQVLDWVRERATGATYADALALLWRRLGCVRDAVVAVDSAGVAMAGGGLAACAEDWLRLAALQLDGTAYGEQVLPVDWIGRSSRPARPFTMPGCLPSTITTHAGFGHHWWPLDDTGVEVMADGSRGQFGFVDHALGIAALKTSLWPYDDWLVDRQLRDLSYLGLPTVAAAAAGMISGG